MQIHTPVICGQPGDDRIEGWRETDFLWADDGNDIISGGPRDTVAADDGGFSFGEQNDGKVNTDFSGGGDEAWALAISPDRKIVAGGYAHDGDIYDADYDFALVRYLPDGQRDSSFGTEGKVTTPIAGTDSGDRAYDCVLDADGKIVLAGSAPYPPGSDSDFVVARYLAWRDIEISGFSVDGQDSTKLEVEYRINHLPVGEFDIGVYASPDGVTPGTRLLDWFRISDPNDLAPGQHAVSIPAVFLNQGTAQDPVYDLEQDYFLMAKVDANLEVAEDDESNNDMVFEGGIFRDIGSDPEDPVNIVHVHGTDTPYPDEGDEQYHKRDIVRLGVGGGYYYVYLNHPNDFDAGHPARRPVDPPSFPDFYWAMYNDTDVYEFHIRTHDGNDSLWTPFWDDPHKVNQSGFEKIIWGFGGDGKDDISGGAEPDRLYGGPGDDVEIVGRAGDDVIHGGPGNDIIEGHDGNDEIYGEGGDDRIEGWGNSDIIYGDYHHDDPLSGSDDGDDIITGGGTPDPEEGEDDEGDQIYGGGGNDRIDGWKGDDWIYGDYHPDDPHSDPNAPLFEEGAGNDEIWGWTGNDTIYGGPGYDDLFGEQNSGAPPYFCDRYMDYDADEDMIWDDDNAQHDAVQRIDLVTDILSIYGGIVGIEPLPNSWDNREENGFYGGKWIDADAALLAPMEIYLDYLEVGYDFSNMKLKLEWTGGGDVVRVYEDAEGSEELTSPKIWEFPDNFNPEQPFTTIYVDGIAPGGAQFTLTLLDENGDPLPGRPLKDLVCVIVI